MFPKQVSGGWDPTAVRQLGGGWNALQRQRPPPVAETGSRCWGRGLQDASAAQGTKQMQGAATRIYRMNLLETLALLTFILALLSLVVDVIRLTVEVMAKFSQMKNDDNKKD